MRDNGIPSEIISLDILYEANKLPFNINKRFYEAQNNVNRVNAHVRTQDELSMELKLSKVR